jgi:hypothetical protein
LVDRLGLGDVRGDIEINVGIDDRANLSNEGGVIRIVDRESDREPIEEAPFIGGVVGSSYSGQLLQPVPGIFLHGRLRTIGAEEVGLEG